MRVIPRKCSAMYLCERLEYILREMKGFFHAEGSGMSLPSLETDIYKVGVNVTTMTPRSHNDFQLVTSGLS